MTKRAEPGRPRGRLRDFSCRPPLRAGDPTKDSPATESTTSLREQLVTGLWRLGEFLQSAAGAHHILRGRMVLDGRRQVSFRVLPASDGGVGHSQVILK